LSTLLFDSAPTSSAKTGSIALLVARHDRQVVAKASTRLLLSVLEAVPSTFKMKGKQVNVVAFRGAVSLGNAS